MYDKCICVMKIHPIVLSVLTKQYCCSRRQPTDVTGAFVRVKHKVYTAQLMRGSSQ